MEKKVADSDAEGSAAETVQSQAGRQNPVTSLEQGLYGTT